jgi:hypothetical protein
MPASVDKRKTAANSSIGWLFGLDVLVHGGRNPS